MSIGVSRKPRLRILLKLTTSPC